MSHTLLDLKHALRARRNGQPDGRFAERAVVGYQQWRAPLMLDEQGQEVLRLDGFGHRRRVLRLYSDDASIAASRRAEGDAVGDRFASRAGAELLASLDERVIKVEVDPHTDAEMTWRADEVEALRSWGRAAQLEEVLANPFASPDGFARLKAYDGYRVVLREVGEEHLMVFAPDDRGRRLAAIFTAQDNLMAFLAEATAAMGFEPFILHTDGAALFERLAPMPLHGLVFNCKGPSPPLAYSMELASLILRA